MLIDPAQFHRVIGIDDHYDVLEVVTYGVDHVFFRVGQFQIVFTLVEVVLILAIVLINAVVVGVQIRCNRGFSCVLTVGFLDQSIHVHRQVSTLTAGAADHDHCGVGEVLGTVHHVIRVNFLGGFRQVPALGADGCSTGSTTALGLVVCIDFGQVIVHFVTCFLQSVQDAGVECSIGGTGSGSAVDRVGGGPTEDVQFLGVFLQRQEAFILEEYKAFLTDLLNGLFTCIGCFF